MFERRLAEAERPDLDSGYLARLASHLGQAVMDELLADGLIELTDRLQRAKDLAATGEMDALARLGHDLVGMAGHLGLARLSSAAAGLNRAARDACGVEDACAQVQEAGRRATEALRRHVAASTPSRARK